MVKVKILIHVWAWGFILVHVFIINHHLPHTGPGSSVGYRFNPGPRYTKVIKLVLAALGLALTYRVELGLVELVSGQPSVSIMWLGVVCQVSGAWYFSDHYKSWALSSLSLPGTIVICWKIVESDVKPEQTNKHILQEIIMLWVRMFLILEKFVKFHCF